MSLLKKDLGDFPIFLIREHVTLPWPPQIALCCRLIKDAADP